MKKKLSKWMPVVRNRYRELPDGTVEIELTRGKTCIIDKADLPLVGNHRWYAQVGGSGLFSAVTAGRRGSVRRQPKLCMHKLLCDSKDATRVNHVDGDSLNNTRRNLRPCTWQENSRAKRRKRSSSSRFKGVSWAKHVQKWRSDIFAEGRNLYVGIFDSESDAAHAYDAAATKHFGEFARLNFPLRSAG